MEEATTLEDLCQNVSTVSRDCIISLPAQSPIYSRMGSMTHRSATAGHMSPSPSPPKRGASVTSPPMAGGNSHTPLPATPPQPVAGPGTRDADSTEIGLWRGGAGGVATGVPPSAESASASIWGGVPMRPVQRSLQELLAQVCTLLTLRNFLIHILRNMLLHSCTSSVQRNLQEFLTQVCTLCNLIA